MLELKQILDAAGDYPGPSDDLYTEQTQFALAQWQAQHHYPNSTPANPQSVTVSLEQGQGYELGNQSTAGLVIGPPDACLGIVHRRWRVRRTRPRRRVARHPTDADAHHPVGIGPGVAGQPADS